MRVARKQLTNLGVSHSCRRPIMSHFRLLCSYDVDHLRPCFVRGNRLLRSGGTYFRAYSSLSSSFNCTSASEMKFLYFSNYEVAGKLDSVEYHVNADVDATVEQQEDDKVLYFVDNEPSGELVNMNNKGSGESDVKVFRIVVPQLVSATVEGEDPDSIVSIIHGSGMTVAFYDTEDKLDLFKEHYEEFNQNCVGLPNAQFDHYFEIVKQNDRSFNNYFFILTDMTYISRLDAYPHRSWADNEEDSGTLFVCIPIDNIPDYLDDKIEADSEF